MGCGARTLALLCCGTAMRSRERTLSERVTYTMYHFSQANPEGPGQDDVPALLRRVADTIEGLGDIQVHDLIMHSEVTPNGDWPSLTVYFDYLSEQP